MAQKGNHKVLLGTLLFSAATFGTSTLVNADELSPKEVNHTQDEGTDNSDSTVITVGEKNDSTTTKNDPSNHVKETKSTDTAKATAHSTTVVADQSEAATPATTSSSHKVVSESRDGQEEHQQDENQLTTSSTHVSLTTENKTQTESSQQSVHHTQDKEQAKDTTVVTDENKEQSTVNNSQSNSVTADTKPGEEQDKTASSDQSKQDQNKEQQDQSKEQNSNKEQNSDKQAPDNEEQNKNQVASTSGKDQDKKKPSADSTDKDQVKDSVTNDWEQAKDKTETTASKDKKEDQSKYKPAKPEVVKTKTVYERAMEDPQKLTQKEIESLSDDELMELAANGKIYDKRFVQTLAVRQSYARSGDAGEAFIQKWGEAARKVAQKYNIYASVMMAQAMLESGYGQSELASEHNNLFGIKAGPGYTGKKVLYWTQEFINGKWYTVQDYFRHYDDLESSFIDNASIIRNGTDWDPYYYKGAWKENCRSYRDATQWLQGRYATDPTYASKLNRIIEQYNLTRFDTPSNGASNEQTTPSTGTIYYTVKSGDTLSKIANQYDTTANKIAKDNKIENPNLIYVGQTLAIHLGNEQETPSQPTTPEKPNSGQTANQTVYYTVQKGDTLSKIASTYKVTVDHIVKENKLQNANLIYVGQKLVIQRGTENSQPNKPANNPGQTTEDKTVYYTVKSGDTLSKIANQYRTTTSKIASDNDIKDSNRIYVGQKLVINRESSTAVSRPTTPQTSNDAQSGYYTVQQGDTISKIANQYRTTVNKIVQDNQLKNPNVIYVGQKLKVSGGSSNSAPSSHSGSNQGGTYTVKSGDNLYEIARRHGMSVNELIKKNNIKDPSLIYVGQQIRL